MSRLRGFVDCCELLQDERDGDISRDDANALTLCTIHQVRTYLLTVHLLACHILTHVLTYSRTHVLTYSLTHLLTCVLHFLAAPCAPPPAPCTIQLLSIRPRGGSGLWSSCLTWSRASCHWRARRSRRCAASHYGCTNTYWQYLALTLTVLSTPLEQP